MNLLLYFWSVWRKMQKKRINILHVTPHLGGGVGRVLLNYLSNDKNNPDFNHTVACLDYVNKNAATILNRLGILYQDEIYSRLTELISMITKQDIILVHWWNHPLLYDFLVRMKLPPSRVIFWSHISGLSAPSVFTRKILTYPDFFVFTTPISYESDVVLALSDKYKERLRVVWSTGGVEHVREVIRKEHTGFNVGYIGTVDYAKMHPDFLAICAKIKIPDIKFIVCGGSNEQAILEEAVQKGISEKFLFTGLINDIGKYLSIFDIFGYPLAPYHYGTCDQVLAESMAAGIVPVVLSNPMERYMIEDGVTGIVASNQSIYIEAIESLFTNQNLRMRLSAQAKDYAFATFSLEKMTQDWEKIFDECMSVKKSTKQWELSGDDKPSARDVFVESLGETQEEFAAYLSALSEDERQHWIQRIVSLTELPTWNTETKGTVHHYHSFFPEDECLEIWSNAMKTKIII